MKKKILLIAIVTGVLMSGCGNGTNKNTNASKEINSEVTESVSEHNVATETTDTSMIPDSELDDAYNNPSDYVGRKISVNLTTIAEPEKGTDGYLYIQGCRSIQDDQYVDCTAVKYSDINFTYTNGDSIKIVGTVVGYTEADETYVGYLNVVADSVEVTNHTYTKEELESMCKEYSYDDIIRNTDELQGSYIKTTAKIFQVLKNDSGTFYDAYMDADADGVYESEICLADYRQSGENLLEDDVIVIYGALDGQTTMTRLSGEEVYIPLIGFLYCDRVSK